ncbi:adenine phosphoribosyltransferase [Campylobacter pinnipediorum]|uniref:Adenine phosphoribosyltransferase n=1 Tax=Campylobacter pinnipediorum subsp. pinnipediorum TaxID=1660067 RepID=A0AAX0LBL3_9BACT|nr:adenine phosphoribosyltransferase [Campylobacter pinnipediorum]AQW81692.1 adenine phosphoribosyltransferase [Campylobacter pinnipediorum subsp. pinnipediorum]AQW83368.1 adenine phosphoribosyltransferase [Campylobacter pinnipediorum subsp. pinnipediorum]AQW84889.1 adenine phosphoribosyltransferase [Campylobacter pinnipediorum subsp. pinnipediorum]OPA79745.1 adenine phosphoribosyltransferase [Campylobacter pinnipediorum subsp. pinnipediorum]OPA81650.1 adenine phosphoribosyltransferase [Campyl
MLRLNEEEKKYLLDSIRSIKDFPKPGIVFKDITTLLNNAKAFEFLMNHLEQRYKSFDLDFIVGIESRGFIFGAALATRLGIGFVPIRKPKKLPYITISQKYSLEYGVDEVQMHIDAFVNKSGAKVLLIDDLIATGGTAKASIELIKQTNANCVEACFLINLKDLGGDKEISKLTNIYNILEI